MTRFKLLLAVLVGTCVYAALSAVYGQNGIFAYRQLQEQKSEISVHTANIQKINDELFLEHRALQDDGEVIAAYARRLDYVAPGEKLVKISGWKPVETKIYDTGTVLRHVRHEWLPEYICKAAGICAFLILELVFIIAALLAEQGGMARSRPRKKPAAARGSPVYDLPQA